MRRCLNHVVAIALVLVSTSGFAESIEPGATPSAQAEQPTRSPTWALRLPTTEPVVFHGSVSYDKAGTGAGGMAYPGIGGPVGFLAAVVTHGLISEATKSAEKTRIQEQADKVLDPYQDMLLGFQHKDLLSQSFGKGLVGTQKPFTPEIVSSSSDWVVESQPQFVMTQDQSAIILENTLTIRRPGMAETTAYRNTVRVVSGVQRAQDLTSFWGADKGANLKTESARLFVRSIELALADAQVQGIESRPKKTIRYLEGKEEKMERAELIEERCGRVVGRTLRGWLLSVPASGDDAGQASGGACS